MLHVPKLWQLTKEESITSFAAWKHNMQYFHVIDPAFKDYMYVGQKWKKSSTTEKLSGFTDMPGAMGKSRLQSARARVNVGICG